ncbi:hypothetical protein BDZ89DRAFT_924024, partial [Hymenopellis radicata]
ITFAGLPMSFWADAVRTVAYLHRRLPTSTLDTDVTPHEAMYEEKPSIAHLQIWGCRVFIQVPAELRVKMGDRMVEGIYVGYEENHKGWPVRDLKGKYWFTDQVVFDELTPGKL